MCHQLVKATINELNYDVKSKLIKIFSEGKEIPTADFKELHIKQEPMYHAQIYLYDEAVDPNQEEIFIEEDETIQEESSHTLFTRRENPLRSNRNTRQFSVNRNACPNRNPSNPHRVNQN